MTVMSTFDATRRASKISVVGAGSVGSSLAYACLIRGSAGLVSLYDIAKDTDAPLDIRLDTDFDQTRENWVKKPMDFLSAAHPSPDGDRVENDPNPRREVWRGIDVINAHERDPKVYAQGIREAVDAVASGHLDPSPLYTHRFPLERLGEALDATRDRPDGFLKALVIP